MKKSIKFIVLALIVFNLSSCEKELMTQELDADIPVIDAYLVAGESEIRVNVATLLPFTEDGATEQSPLEGLAININRNGTNYTMVETSNGVYELSNIDILPNDIFNLSLDYNGKSVSSSTVIPTNPINFSLSQTDMFVEKVEEGEIGQPSFNQLEISWSGDGYYFLTIEYLESSQDLINGNFGETELPNTKTTSIINGTGYNLGMRDLFFFGTYKIELHHVNEEYAELFENISQSSQNLTNPVSNIENGWGIFTGYNVQTLYLEIHEL